MGSEISRLATADSLSWLNAVTVIVVALIVACSRGTRTRATEMAKSASGPVDISVLIDETRARLAARKVLGFGRASLKQSKVWHDAPKARMQTTRE